MAEELVLHNTTRTLVLNRADRLAVAQVRRDAIRSHGEGRILRERVHSSFDIADEVLPRLSQLDDRITSMCADRPALEMNARIIEKHLVNGVGWAIQAYVR